MVTHSFHFKYLQAWVRTKIGDAAFRIIEFALSLGLVLVFAPIWLIHFIVALAKGSHWLDRSSVLGFQGRVFQVFEARTLERGLFCSFFNYPLIRKSPMVLSVLQGHLSLVGPAPLALSEKQQLDARHLRRLDVRPGVVHTFFLRSSANIAFEDERELALKDAERTGLLKRIGMLLRAVPAVLFRTNKHRQTDRLRMFGLDIHNLTRSEAVALIVAQAARKERFRIAFVNPACINIAMKNEKYRSVLSQNDAVFADGIGMHVACKLLGLSMKDNLNGTDLFPALCEKIQETGHGLYLLGSRPGVCEAMIENVWKSWPGVAVRGYHHGYFKDGEIPSIVEDINRSRAQILLVALGAPRQELLIDQILPELRLPVVMGVGGLFDFMSRRIPRAPAWMREMGLEWLYRLIQEPGRLWKRYIIGNLVFLWNTLRYGK